MSSFRWTSVLLGITLCATAWSHHSRRNFDLENTTELRGTITEYSWRNPHTFAKLEVETDAGDTEEWLLELNSISVLTGTGWNRDTLHVGDEVTVVGNLEFEPGSKLFFSNYFVLPDGHRMVSAPNYSRGVPIARPPDREIDATARSDDFSGIWRPQGMGMGAAPAAVSFGGQTQSRGLPLTAAGHAEVDAFDVEDNPWFRCEPRSLPWLVSATQEIVRVSDGELLFRYEIMEVERAIYLDMTEHPADVEPSHLGHSIGRFEEGSLVIDTANFAPAVWGIGAGVPSSDQKHVVERYTLTDGNRLSVEYTVEDPVYLAAPVTLSATFFLDAGYPWQDYNCDPLASRRHLTLE